MISFQSNERFPFRAMWWKSARNDRIGRRADLMARERIRDEARHFNLGSGLWGGIRWWYFLYPVQSGTAPTKMVKLLLRADWMMIFPKQKGSVTLHFSIPNMRLKEVVIRLHENLWLFFLKSASRQMWWSWLRQVAGHQRSGFGKKEHRSRYMLTWSPQREM